MNFDLIEIPKYIDHTKDGGKVFRYLSSAGCPYHCSFCFIPLGWKGKWFPKSVDTVINEVKQIISNAPQINYLSFEDLNFFVDHKRVIDICNGFIDNNINISWCATTHVKTFLQQYDDNDIELLKKAGLDCIIVGAESGDQSLLNQVNKQLQISEIFDFIRILDDHEIKTSWSFMVLFPTEPGKDLNKTLKLIMQMFLKTRKSTLLYVASVYWPATKSSFYQIALQKGFEQPKDLISYIKIANEGAVFPWHKASHLRKLKYFGMFYFRFYKYNNPGKPDGKEWFLEKIFSLVFRPFILLRFRLKYVGFPFAGWLYCLIFKNKIDREGYFTPKANRSVTYQIQNY
ncbi:MAG TPA: radical SAM protein [Bacteroidales bacterium]|nr:radical SAM protein [Bacteroidales bacterium]